MIAAINSRSALMMFSYEPIIFSDNSYPISFTESAKSIAGSFRISLLSFFFNKVIKSSKFVKLDFSNNQLAYFS